MEPSLVASWPMALQIIIFIVALLAGIFCLVKFCDVFVDGASSLAKKLKISSLIIGLTVVAIGTSLPELAVSVSDSISCLQSGGNANVAIGNVVGSNICNLLIVLGLSCAFVPIVVKKSICKREFPFMIMVMAVFILFGLAFGLNGQYALLRWEGIILVVLMFVYIFFLIFTAKKDAKKASLEGNTEEDIKNEEEYTELPMWKTILFVIVGAIGVVAGGQFVVFGAKGLALRILVDGIHCDANLSESLVGLTIVAVGTSLPEIVTSTIAAKKGENELALGNVIGSNIFNVLMVLGIASVVCPLTSGSQIVVDLIVMGASTLIVYGFCLTGKLKRSTGWIFVGLYVAYLIYLIVRTVAFI